MESTKSLQALAHEVRHLNVQLIMSCTQSQQLRKDHLMRFHCRKKSNISRFNPPFCSWCLRLHPFVKAKSLKSSPALQFLLSLTCIAPIWIFDHHLIQYYLETMMLDIVVKGRSNNINCCVCISALGQVSHPLQCINSNLSCIKLGLHSWKVIDEVCVKQPSSCFRNLEPSWLPKLFLTRTIEHLSFPEQFDISHYNLSLSPPVQAI